MPVDVLMPRLSDSMEEGTILAWLVEEGQQVSVGDELVEIETDKANMVFEADADGLVQHVASIGDTLPIGALIARITVSGEQLPDGIKAQVHGGEARTPISSSGLAVHAPSAPGDGSDARVKASPLARRVAAANQLNLAGVVGTGPGGRIVKSDIEGALASGSAPAATAGGAESPPPAAGVPPTSSPAQAGNASLLMRGDAPPAPGDKTAPAAASPGARGAESARGAVRITELSRLQQTVARRMAESKATAPHFYLQAEIDMSRCVAARSRIKRTAPDNGVVPSFNDMVVKAAAIALREFPRANGAYRDGRWELYERINVGIAVAAADALVVPTIFDADRKGLQAIALESRALAAKVRDGAVTPPELAGGTFTVSNLGMYGMTNFHPVIYPPQAAILAVGAIREQPVVREGEIIIAQTMGVTLACDHRILHGAEGATFLARIGSVLEEPLGLAL